MIDFRTSPERYRHWRLELEPPIARLLLDVDEHGGLGEGYELKLNSYDLGVDIELADAVQRLRFEHPEIRTVVIGSAKERVFSAGANIRMLGLASHTEKVGFCKFTNETRNAIEEASAHSGQRYLCAIEGTAAGGGYELALATDYILLADDGASAVSLPEVPVLGVLPGTGGLVRLVDKRRVRRDRADFFCTREEGLRGQRAVEWGLVDETALPSRFAEVLRERALEAAHASDRPVEARGMALTPLSRELREDRIDYRYVQAELDACAGVVRITLRGPAAPVPADLAELSAQGEELWPLAIARELDDLILHLRHNEPALGTWLLRSEGELEAVARVDRFLLEHREDWLVREVVLYWKRVLKRLEVTSRSLIALVEPGSCFAGTLLEVVLASDRSFMLAAEPEGEGGSAAAVRLTGMNRGPLPGVNGLTRLAARGADGEHIAALEGADLRAARAAALGLVTFTPDDIDWEDEVRLACEERAGYSPDALTGMEASLRCAGPETMESKIFGRLSAWQNWIFQRPNAVGERGALTRYGTGLRAEYDKRRV